MLSGAGSGFADTAEWDGFYVGEPFPHCFVSASGGQQCEGYDRDVGCVRARPDGRFNVGLALNFLNGHVCTFHGIGTPMAGILRLDSDPAQPSCLMRVTLDEGVLRQVGDMSADCSRCGSRGGFAGFRLRLVNEADELSEKSSDFEGEPLCRR